MGFVVVRFFGRPPCKGRMGLACAVSENSGHQDPSTTTRRRPIAMRRGTGPEQLPYFFSGGVGGRSSS